MTIWFVCDDGYVDDAVSRRERGLIGSLARAKTSEQNWYWFTYVEADNADDALAAGLKHIRETLELRAAMTRINSAADLALITEALGDEL